MFSAAGAVASWSCSSASNISARRTLTLVAAARRVRTRWGTADSCAQERERRFSSSASLSRQTSRSRADVAHSMSPSIVFTRWGKNRPWIGRPRRATKIYEHDELLHEHAAGPAAAERHDDKARCSDRHQQQSTATHADFTGTAVTIGVVAGVVFALASLRSAFLDGGGGRPRAVDQTPSEGAGPSCRSRGSPQLDDISVSLQLDQSRIFGLADVRDFEFIAEGGMNMVFAWRNNPSRALRIRKKGHAQLVLDQQFRARVVQPLLKDCGIQVPELRLATKDFVQELTRGKGDVRPVVPAGADGAAASASSRKKTFAGRGAGAGGGDEDLDELLLQAAASATRHGRYVLVSTLPNAIAAAKGVPTITIEIKPKCGLQEVETLPTRFEMLQHEKVRKGEVATICEYNPVQFFRPRTTARAMEALFDQPQNFLRIFVAGLGDDDEPSPAGGGASQRMIFGQELLTGASKMDYETQRMNTRRISEAVLLGQAQSSGASTSFSSRIALARDKPLLPSLVEEVVRLDPAWNRLLHVQAWAAGATAEYANELLSRIERNAGSAAPSSSSLSLTLDDYASAVQKSHFRPFLPDESGMRLSEREGRKLLEQARRSEVLPGERGFATSSQTNLRQEMRNYICRYLLGRMAMDVSVMLSFAAAHSGGDEDALRSSGFKPLPGGRWQNVWYRLIVVDTDAKPVDRIPGYSTQLAEYERAWRRADHAGEGEGRT